MAYCQALAELATAASWRVSATNPEKSRRPLSSSNQLLARCPSSRQSLVFGQGLSLAAGLHVIPRLGYDTYRS